VSGANYLTIHLRPNANLKNIGDFVCCIKECVTSKVQIGDGRRVLMFVGCVSSPSRPNEGFSSTTKQRHSAAPTESVSRWGGLWDRGVEESGCAFPVSTLKDTISKQVETELLK